MAEKQKPTLKKAPAAPRRKRRSSEEILERLIGAAEEEFRRCGYAGTTTAAIAQRADVTEAQLFRYFSSKAELFHEAIFKPLSAHVVAFSETHFRPSGEPHQAESGDFREAARLYIGEMQEFIAGHAEMLMSLLVAQAYPPTLTRGVGELDSLQDYFERAASMMSQRASKNPRVDPRLMVRVSFAAIMGNVLFKPFLIPQGVGSDDDISAAIIEFVMDGISVKPSAPQEAGPAVKPKVAARAKPKPKAKSKPTAGPQSKAPPKLAAAKPSRRRKAASDAK